MRIFIIEKKAINVDNENDAIQLLEQGARELTTEEIIAAGMIGYEHLVGPNNTTITDDGDIIFVPPVISLEEAKFRKLEEIKSAVDTTLAPLSEEYPYKEVLSFSDQEKEARAYMNDPSARTPLLSSIAASRGIEIDELVQKVIAKADATTAAIGFVIGASQKDKDKLAVANTVEEVEAIIPAYSLPVFDK